MLPSRRQNSPKSSMVDAGNGSSDENRDRGPSLRRTQLDYKAADSVPTDALKEIPFSLDAGKFLSPPAPPSCSPAGRRASRRLKNTPNQLYPPTYTAGVLYGPHPAPCCPQGTFHSGRRHLAAGNGTHHRVRDIYQPWTAHAK